MKPQDRNVNSVCLSSQEPVALSTFWCVLWLIGGYFMSANVNVSVTVNVATLSHQHISLHFFNTTFLLLTQYIAAFFKSYLVFASTTSPRPRTSITRRGKSSVGTEWLHLQVICMKHLVQSAFPRILRKHEGRFPFDVNNTLLKWMLQRPLRNTRYVWISRQIWRGYAV